MVFEGLVWPRLHQGELRGSQHSALCCVSQPRLSPRTWGYLPVYHPLQDEVCCAQRLRLLTAMRLPLLLSCVLLCCVLCPVLCCAVLSHRSRERERGPRFSNRAEDMRVTQDVEDLFTEAAKVLARTTRRYPVNISSINDIMRHRDR